MVRLEGSWPRGRGWMVSCLTSSQTFMSLHFFLHKVMGADWKGSLLDIIFVYTYVELLKWHFHTCWEHVRLSNHLHRAGSSLSRIFKTVEAKWPSHHSHHGILAALPRASLDPEGPGGTPSCGWRLVPLANLIHLHPNPDGSLLSQKLRSLQRIHPHSQYLPISFKCQLETHFQAGKVFAHTFCWLPFLSILGRVTRAKQQVSRQILHHGKDAFKFTFAEVLDDSPRRALGVGGRRRGM